MGPKPFSTRDYSGIPAKLRELRLDRGFTIQQVAEQMGVSASCVSQWEYGNNGMSVNALADYCRVLDASILVEFRNVLYDVSTRR